MGQHSAQPLGPRATAFHGPCGWTFIPPVVEPIMPAGLPREGICVGGGWWKEQGEWKEENSQELFLGKEKWVAPFKSSFSGQSEKKSSVGCSSPQKRFCRADAARPDDDVGFLRTAGGGFVDRVRSSGDRFWKSEHRGIGLTSNRNFCYS